MILSRCRLLGIVNQEGDGCSKGEMWRLGLLGETNLAYDYACTLIQRAGDGEGGFDAGGGGGGDVSAVGFDGVFYDTEA
ncbi:MAG: hypothetical protein ACI9SQ_000230 [Rubritalea sp.]|jgi:hypothetical protein